MELTTRMLADAAQRTPDGKLNVLGGQFDRLMAPAFPATHPSLAVVLVLSVGYHEALVPHILAIQLTRDGEAKGPGATAGLELGHPPGLTLGAPQSATLVFTFPMVTFEAPGRYEWLVAVDGIPLGSMPLEVVKAPVPPGLAAARTPAPGSPAPGSLDPGSLDPGSLDPGSKAPRGATTPTTGDSAAGGYL
jgi:hypothetical protein